MIKYSDIRILIHQVLFIQLVISRTIHVQEIQHYHVLIETTIKVISLSIEQKQYHLILKMFKMVCITYLC